jgi:type IV pilus assembly protein PilM
MFDRFPQRIQNFFAPPMPALACEISDHHLALVRLDNRDPRVVEQFALAALPDGLVQPSLTSPILASPGDFEGILKSTLGKAEIKSNRLALALPDAVFRISLQTFDTFSGSEHEKMELLKWKLKKTLPFNIDEGRLTYWATKGTDGKVMVLSACAFAPVLEQVEKVFEKSGLRAGYITLSSLASLEFLGHVDGVVLENTLLLLKVQDRDISVLIIGKGIPLFFRHNSISVGDFSAPGEDAGGEWAARIYNEIHPCLMYYQDKYGTTGMDAIYLSSGSAPDRAQLAWVSRETGCPVNLLDPLRWMQFRGQGNWQSARFLLTSSLGLAMSRF